MSSGLNKMRVRRIAARRSLRYFGLVLAALTIVNALRPPAVIAQTTSPPPKQKSYKIVFRGNHALSETTLRKAAVEELTAFQQQDHRQADIDDAAFLIKLAYRKNGYAFATVDYRIEPVEGEPVVSFTINEGPRVILNKIEIIGNAGFDTQKLLPFFEGEKSGLFGRGKLLFVKSDIQAALSRMRDFYVTEGYRDVVVGEPNFSFSIDRTEAAVTIKIEEGIRYVIHAILFQGDLVAEAEDSLKKLRRELIGKPYFRRQSLLLQSRLLEIYGNLGYPQSTAEIDEQEGAQPGMVQLAAKISKGPRVTISAILIRGNEKTSKNFIRSRLLLKPGDRYNLERQKESFSRLYKTGLFSNVDLRLEKQAGTDRWPLLIEVKEARARELYFEPGWGSYEKLRLKVGYREKNLFGTGRTFSLDATASLKAQSLVASLSDPWFLNSDISAELPVYYSRREEPSFTRTDVGGSLLFSKTLTAHLSASGGYGLRKTDVSDVDPEIAAQDATTGYNFASLKLQTTYDSRDDLFFPTRGQRSFISGEHAGSFLGSQVTLTRLTAEMRYFLPLTRTTVLGLRYRTGLIVPGPDDFNLPISEKFFNGGENTVRSFKQSELGPKDEDGNPVGGLAFNVFNVELRQRLIGNLTGSLFFDSGNVAPNQIPAEKGNPPYDSRSEILSDTFNQYFKDLRYGIGVGLQYLLPVGPARLDVAVNPDRDTEMNEDLYVLHFSVGMAF